MFFAKWSAAAGFILSAQEFAESLDRRLHAQSIHDPPTRGGGARNDRFAGVLFQFLHVGDRAPAALDEQAVDFRMLEEELARDFIGRVVGQLDLIDGLI